MEQNLADLLRDAFEEASGPYFHKADSDFENVYFEEDTSSIFCENSPTNEKKNLQQEAAAFCSGDVINRAETVEEELPGEAAVQGEVVVNTGKSQEGCDTSSWEGSAQGGGDEEEDEGEEMSAGKQLLLAYKGDKHHGNSQADRARASVERRPLPPEEGENTPVGNEEQGESDEISYFQSVPEHSSKTERTEGDQQEIDKAAKSKEEEEEEEEEQDEDDYDDEHKDEGEEEEDKLLSLCFKQEVKNAHWDDQAEDILDFLELKVQNLQDLMADEEEPVQKMEDFSEEDHQEAGERFLQCPSDVSSCENQEHGEGDDGSSGLWAGGQGPVQRETDVGNRETEEWKDELVETVSGDITASSSDTSDSFSSGDEEDGVTSEGVLNQLDEHHGGSRDDLLVDNERFPDVTLRPAEGVGMSSGSLDDSFFSSAECQRPQVSGLEEVGDDENEEKSHWEQEQERIRAFNEFYEDSGQEGTGRQTKVQFSTELFSQVILYERDSSGRDSLSSSDGEEELSSAEAPEEPKEPTERAEIEPSYDVPNTRAASASHLSHTQQSSQRQCVNMLKVTLTMGVIIATGLLMLWWATDQAGWLSRVTFR